MRQVPFRVWGLAILSGVLQVLPFPLAGPVPLWRTHICWFALLPLLIALLTVRKDGSVLSRGQGAGVGYLAGVIWYLGNCYWIFQTMNLYGGLPAPVAAAILLLFCLYLGLYHALFGWLFASLHDSRLGRQGALLLVPVIWVATELARSRITGFPWDLLGMTQVDSLTLRQLAPWTGVSGLSFLIALVNALWLLRITVRDRRWTRTVLVAAGSGIVLLYVGSLLHLRSRPREAQEWATATLLQENLDVGSNESGRKESEAQLLAEFSALSRRPAATLLNGIPEVQSTRLTRRQQITLALPKDATSADALFEPTDLVVWPESPAPFQEGQPAFRAGMSTLAQQMQVPIIVGNIGVGRNSNRADHVGSSLFNSASFIRPDGGFAGRYDKMHLVPFGEYVPYKELFFFAGSLLQEVGTFEPGQQRSMFSVDHHTFGIFICYESIFGDEVREFSKQGANVLVNISNDGWYGDTSAPWEHLNMVRMRALETHRWVLRATNTGITSAIDPDGRIVAAAPRHVRTAIRVPFAYEHDLTFYAAHGDVLPWSCFAVTVVALTFAEWSRRTHRAEWQYLQRTRDQ